MVLNIVIAFVVLKILNNLVSTQKSCLQIVGERSRITKSYQCELIFIFIELSKPSNSFVKIRLVLEIKNVANFIKTRFY